MIYGDTRVFVDRVPCVIHFMCSFQYAAIAASCSIFQNIIIFQCSIASSAPDVQPSFGTVSS